jgi:homoserine dehydrogenase
MSNELKIGIAGLGNVGVGVVKILARQGELLSRRSGTKLTISAVSARNRNADRGIDITPYEWCDDAIDLARRDDVDVVIELIGGEDGPARALVETALSNGKHVVTANKALIARHGESLAKLAESKGLALNYEAAVAGGIPIIKALREGLAANQFSRVYGILNGTCNYILTEMEETGRDFDDVLVEAQQLGYAEADPAFDVDGVDAAHKLAILTSVAYGCPVNFDAIHVEGIREISAIDIAYAAKLGYRIKLLGLTSKGENGIEQRVHPCLVPQKTPIAKVDGVFNAVVADGDFVDRTVFEGRGAGEGPTASAVLADIVDIARGTILPTFSIPVDEMKSQPTASMLDHFGAYYMRLNVLDVAGVIADISAILRDEEVSIESLLQQGRKPGEAVPVVLITHECREASMMRVVDAIEALEVTQERPRLIRMENFE